MKGVSELFVIVSLNFFAVRVKFSMPFKLFTKFCAASTNTDFTFSGRCNSAGAKRTTEFTQLKKDAQVATIAYNKLISNDCCVVKELEIKTAVFERNKLIIKEGLTISSVLSTQYRFETQLEFQHSKETHTVVALSLALKDNSTPEFTSYLNRPVNGQYNLLVSALKSMDTYSIDNISNIPRDDTDNIKAIITIKVQLLQYLELITCKTLSHFITVQRNCLHKITTKSILDKNKASKATLATAQVLSSQVNKTTNPERGRNETTLIDKRARHIFKDLGRHEQKEI